MNAPTDNEEKSFEESANESSLGLFAEFILFLRENKAWWMIPILLTLILIFVVAWLASSPVLAPFIYPLF
ncbi:DUF5989 family protein [Planctomicrobium sp.]|jgi:hypothetical protein|nr:DUF5989 family protein [Planctomicrobium sp.]MDB4743144.1 DUF5989 family protein [Planctomicrobium sp.]MDB4802791.1 DUF5989 family protein [bacterium]